MITNLPPKGMATNVCKTGLIVCLLFAINFISLNPLSAQAASEEFLSLKNKIVSNIHSVTAGEDVFDQTLSSVPDAPYQVNFSITHTDKKGKSIAYKYSLNLQDIDRNLVRWSAKKDLIEVTLKTSRRQNLIQHYEDGEQQNFESQFTILATDADNGKEIQKLFRDIIPLAVKGMEAQLNIPDFDSQAKWLTENITNATVEEDTYQQSWLHEEGDPLKVTFTAVVPGKKETLEELLAFNLADLNEQSVEMVVKGKKVFVDIETQRKRRMIGLKENGTLEDYVSSIQIYTNEIASARALVQVLKKIIPDAKKQMKTKLAFADDPQKLLSLLAEQLQGGKIEDESYEQKIEPTCGTTLTLTETNSKGTDEYVYQFNFADLNLSDTEVVVKGKEIFIENSIHRNNKLIKHLENGVLQNYENNIDFRGLDIENARQISLLIPLIVDFCKTELATWSPPGELTANLEWLEKNIGTVTTPSEQVDQSFKITESGCKIELTQIESNDKKTVEEIFEFNLTDINPREVQFNTSRKNLIIELETQYGDKTIKAYRDGKTENYTNEITILSNELETARQLTSVIKQTIEQCNK